MKLWQYPGKAITIYFKDGDKPMTGKCIGYISALDNYPEEVESIIVGSGADYHEIRDYEIDHIELVEENNSRKDTK